MHSQKNFPPPISATRAILPLYEEEFFRQGNKSFRITISKFGEEQYIGLSQWYFQIWPNQMWMPTTKQVQMTRFGWQSFLNLLPSIENELLKIVEAEGTEVINNPGKILFKFHSYLFILFDYNRYHFPSFIFKAKLIFSVNSSVFFIGIFSEVASVQERNIARLSCAEKLQVRTLTSASKKQGIE